MKEIVVISGKGGTGKTSLTASFAMLGGSDVIVADCDVDAADMHLLLQPKPRRTEQFYSGLVASIDQELCIQCGKCAEVCRFDAIEVRDGRHVVDATGCEGCGYCPRVCPVDAITMSERLAGAWYISDIRSGSIMVHAKLGIGAENSGKLVAKVKNEAKRIADEASVPFVLVDGSPGIGCPVVSSLSGAAYVVLVTEPTESGLHDFRRVHELVQRFRIRSGYIINKVDLNARIAEKIRTFAEEKEIDALGNLPYEEAITAAMVEGLTLVDAPDMPVSLVDKVRQAWKTILENT